MHSSNSTIIDSENLKKVTHKLYQAHFKKIFDIDIEDDIMSAFRPPEILQNQYSLDQVQRIGKICGELILRINALPDKDKYNIKTFECTLVKDLEEIIQNNRTNFVAQT